MVVHLANQDSGIWINVLSVIKITAKLEESATVVFLKLGENSLF